MLEAIRYRILMRKLRGEIAATIREQFESPVRTDAVSEQTGVKPTCKACVSIV